MDFELKLPSGSPAYAHEIAAKINASMKLYRAMQQANSADPALMQIIKEVSELVDSCPSWTLAPEPSFKSPKPNDYMGDTQQISCLDAQLSKAKPNNQDQLSTSSVSERDLAAPQERRSTLGRQPDQALLGPSEAAAEHPLAQAIDRALAHVDFAYGNNDYPSSYVKPVQPDCDGLQFARNPYESENYLSVSYNEFNNEIAEDRRMHGPQAVAIDDPLLVHLFGILVVAEHPVTVASLVAHTAKNVVPKVKSVPATA